MATKKAPTPKTKTVEAAVAKVAKAVKAMTPSAPLISAEELQRLRKMNLWLTLAFAVQAVAVVAVGGAKAVPVVASYVSVDQLSSQTAGHQVLAMATRHLFDVRLTVVAAVFLAAFALVSLVLATVGRTQYEAQLQRGSNVGRWIGFALGGGLMVVALGLESMAFGVASLIALFAFTALAAGLEPLADKLYRESTGAVRHVLCVIAVAAGVMPWLFLGLGVLGAILWNGHVPGDIYMMYLTTLVLFGCWVLAGHFRIVGRGRWADVLYAEKMYMFLGLASATVLAWQIFAGAL